MPRTTLEEYETYYDRGSAELALVYRLVRAFERQADAAEASVALSERAIVAQEQLAKSSGALEAQLLDDLAKNSAGAVRQ